MNKFISGHERDHTDVHSQMRSAKQEYLDSMVHLRGKKDEYKDLKKENDEERKRLRIEEKKAASFKFGKMEKQVPFLPSIVNTPHFEEFKTI